MHLHGWGREVCIKARSPPASLPFKGQVTERTTVKWSICNNWQPIWCRKQILWELYNKHFHLFCRNVILSLAVFTFSVATSSFQILAVCNSKLLRLYSWQSYLIQREKERELIKICGCIGNFKVITPIILNILNITIIFVKVLVFDSFPTTDIFPSTPVNRGITRLIT